MGKNLNIMADVDIADMPRVTFRKTMYDWNKLGKVKKVGPECLPEDKSCVGGYKWSHKGLHESFCGPHSKCQGYQLKGSYTTTTDKASITYIEVDAYLTAPEGEDFAVIRPGVDLKEKDGKAMEDIHVISWGISQMWDRKIDKAELQFLPLGTEIWTQG